MKADDWINRWKTARRSEVPTTPEDFTDRVLERIEDSEPAPSVPPMLWIVRFMLAVLAVALVTGRLVGTVAVFLTSTSLQ